MTVFALLISTLLKLIFEPFASVSLRTIRASTLLLVISLSSIFRIGSLKVSVISLSTNTSVSPSAGSKLTVGGSTSAVVNVELVVAIKLPSSSSTQQIST